ncbi:hypothetical protein G7Y89_g2410 [Cudoniella acicularis]|uniref:Endo-1,4-beta-xylanase n=1 Tax=Cudoniella acicularis TaxID=354080 RepID=A0A8H4W8N3_9HELO|nr:hypothetical protein G7Y89_g2410 [Cudoniella acicularis]
MVLFSSFLLVASAVLAVPGPASQFPQPAGTPSSGINNGFYYKYWDDGAATATYINGAAGQYNLTWSDSSGNIIGGKGWNPGSGRTITYSGTFAPDGNAYLSIYGWTTNPLVEYHIVESYGSYNPSNGTVGAKKGIVTTDGGTYDILETFPISIPPIPGVAIPQRYWSVRTSKRVGGTVTTQAHFDAWEKVGMKLGDHNYQIVATEGYHGSGFSSITVS